MAVRVLTDTASALDDAQCRDLGIVKVPLHVIDGGEILSEDQLHSAAFYERLASAQRLPTTSQPSPSEFAAAFARALEAGDDVLVVTISAGMSGTLGAAQVAAAEAGDRYRDARIAVVDSRSNSLQEGFAVLAAAEVAAAGGSIEECRVAAQGSIARSRFLFAPRTLEYLRRGGRISGASALLGSVLKIVPVLTAEKGSTAVASVARSWKSAKARITSLLQSDVDRHGLSRVAVQYFGEPEEALRFASDVVEPAVGVAVPVVPIHPVVGLHVGPALGVVYETREPLR